MGNDRIMILTQYSSLPFLTCGLGGGQFLLAGVDNPDNIDPVLRIDHWLHAFKVNRYIAGQAGLQIIKQHWEISFLPEKGISQGLSRAPGLPHTFVITEPFLKAVMTLSS